jgi:hypothetical protein
MNNGGVIIISAQCRNGVINVANRNNNGNGVSVSIK